MAINYSVNGRNITTVSRCQWPPNQTSEDYQNVLGYSEWYTHLWLVSRMRMGDYEFLDSLRGSELINVVSGDIDDHNAQLTYPTARMVNVEGVHRGLVMDNVRVEFLIKVTDGV